MLIVEDDRDIRQAMEELLQEQGYDCVFAENGLEALETLSLRTPSLVLIDLLMPVMNGVELIGRLQRDPRWSSLPVVVMTGAGDRIIGVDLKSLKVPILRKPVDIESLQQMLVRHSRADAEIPEDQ